MDSPQVAPGMADRQPFREAATDAIRYWEPRRLLYNAILAAVVVACFAWHYPASKSALTFELAQGVFLLAVLANVAYCAAYLADIFAQTSVFREQWRKNRWVLFLIGATFAAVLTRIIAWKMFRVPAV